MRIRETPIVEQDQALKVMVEASYQEMKEKAKASIEKAVAVSLTSDMWTSNNTEAYLGVTCHFVDDVPAPTGFKGLNAVVLGAQNFSNAHTAENITQVKGSLMTEWAITDKVTCLVTDGAANIGALVQEQLRKPRLKLIQEVETCWNSTYNTLQRLFYLTTDIQPVSSEELGIISECLVVLAPFNDATTELSQEKRVSGSKVIPLLTMLDHCLNEQMEKSPSIGSSLAQKLRMLLREKLDKIQTMSIMFLATLLDPRFRKLGFLSPARASEAEKRLKAECASVMRASTTSSSSTPPPQPSTSQTVEAVSHGNNLWRRLDESIRQTQTQNVTADANIEAQRYMMEPNIGRLEDPLKYWERQKYVYPHLYKLALTYLCTPASSVPCERVFSKAGNIVQKKEIAYDLPQWRNCCF
ncbi:chromosome alignment-maintaining phosphoprotein 1 [Sarotherodon galilaeus]